jgi:hypothetical protein
MVETCLRERPASILKAAANRVARVFTATGVLHEFVTVSTPSLHL